MQFANPSKTNRPNGKGSSEGEERALRLHPLLKRVDGANHHAFGTSSAGLWRQKQVVVGYRGR